MLNPAFHVRRPFVVRQRVASRTGAILPLFAFLLPVLLILCGFAINLAYMQLTSTELKIATDAAAHAGGRAMSIHQTTDHAIAQAKLTALANSVGGKFLSVSTENGNTDDVEIKFGTSPRLNNGYGMYQFSEIPKAEVDSGAKQATSLAVVSNINFPMIFKVMDYNYFGGNRTEFNAARRSVATQVDRDIALVLDRSGSMQWYKDEIQIRDALNSIYDTYDTYTEPGYTKYAFWKKRGNGTWQWKGYYKWGDQDSNWEVRDWNDTQWEQGQTYQQRRISSSERSNGRNYSNPSFTDNVIYQLERWANPSHTLGDAFEYSENSQLTVDMAQFAFDIRYVNNKAPRHSRWYYLDLGVKAFLDVLETTDQDELIALITFSSSASLNHGLQKTQGDPGTYANIRNTVSGINPSGSTAIGDGMLEGLPPIVTGKKRDGSNVTNSETPRPFAAKTIVVLSDGQNMQGADPVGAAESIIANYNVTIHTVTFTQGADQTEMETVAEKGFGRHYHADTGQGLIDVFEEIANNLPTILTE